MATFRLAADPVVDDLSDGDVIRYRVMVRLISPSGRFVGAGVGECSSQEDKYRWRQAVAAEEFDEAPVHQRREKWRRKWDNKTRGYRQWKEQQVQTNSADLANTILKMAKKRALVDAVLTATAASDVFAQDLEDLPAEYLANQDSGPASRPRQPDHRPPPGATQEAADDPDTMDLIESLSQQAQQGWAALQKAWGGVSEEQRRKVGGRFRQIKEVAMRADEQEGGA
jgi:hypothetical protein